MKLEKGGTLKVITISQDNEDSNKSKGSRDEERDQLEKGYVMDILVTNSVRGKDQALLSYEA